MTIRRYQLAVSAVAFLAVAGCGPRDSQDRPRTGGNIAASAEPAACVVIVTVDDDDGNTEQHLKLEQQIRLVGPNGVAQDYEVRPVVNPKGAPAHEWLPKKYDAVNVSVTTPAKDYQLFVDVLAPGKHAVKKQHFYTMEIIKFGEDGCPSYVEFDAGVDLDSVSGDHGGHAGALR